MREVGAFEQRYADEGDPWQFATSPYERSRLDTIMSLLPNRTGTVFEPGCATGELTARLATRSTTVVACDVSPTAVRQAQVRCRRHDNVLLAVAEFPTFWPRRRFSVLVVSEFGYYFSEQRFGALAHDLCHLIEPGGVLLACHWLGSSPDHRTTGAQVHGHLDRCPELRPRARAQVPNPGREAGCEIKVWSRR